MEDEVLQRSIAERGKKEKGGKEELGKVLLRVMKDRMRGKKAWRQNCWQQQKNVYIKEWNLSSAINLLWNIDFCRKHGEYNFYMLAFHI